MQLYALQTDKRLILAEEAEKQKEYLCPECLGTVHVRSGPQRRPHFYHKQDNQECRQSGKSLEHLQLQLYLKKIFPEALLEAPFPAIGRIADVFLPSQNLIFEIQRSHISLIEAQERMRDYGDYRVIWILHDKEFNQKFLSPAEHFLRQNTCYFTNFDAHAKGVIYDQYEKLEGAKRLFRGAKLPISLALQKKVPSPLPDLLQSRALWQTHFQGDLIDQIVRAKPQELSGIFALERPKRQKKSLYRALLNHLLSRL